MQPRTEVADPTPISLPVAADSIVEAAALAVLVAVVLAVVVQAEVGKRQHDDEIKETVQRIKETVQRDDDFESGMNK